MSFNLSGLEKVKARKPVPSKAPWAPLDFADLHEGTYIAADPSIDAFGLVLVTVTEDHKVIVNGAQKFTIPNPGGAKWQSLFDRVTRLEVQLTAYIGQWYTAEKWAYEPCAVHEMPPVGGGKVRSPEVALLASYAFLNATRGTPMLPFVPRARHARLWVEEQHPDKKTYHAVIKTHLPRILNSDMITNEAHRDALSVGLCAARDRH